MIKNYSTSLILTIILLMFHGADSMAQNMVQGQDLKSISNESGLDTRVFYSVFVQSFYDSNNDGIGDIKGLTSKLEYLKDLGIGGLWLLPIHPSPTYHKYDVEDFLGIHADYGSLNDYKELVQKAHELDIKVLLDLVVNHTSNRHPWFVKAASGNKKFRNYYLWSSDSEDFENDPYQWHQVRDENGNKKDGERYYGRLWWEIPELNFDEQEVREEIIDVGEFWLKEVGVDGFHLDAADQIYPPDQINKALLWWQEFHYAMKEINSDVMIFGEVLAGSEKISPYLKTGFTSGFNFELSDTIRKSVLEGRDLGIIATVTRINERYKSSNPDFNDATILTNHDMIRVMTELSRDLNKAKTASALLLTLPGNPFIYYGEEIGMLGEKPDEYIREPFLWNIEGEDSGQTNWEIPFASSSKTVKPLVYQIDNQASIYNHYKALINLRNSSSALSGGGVGKIETNNSKIIAFFRYSDDQEAIILMNLSEDLERIPTLKGLDGFELAYSNFNVFKINDKEISLQANAIFILTRDSQVVRHER